MNTSSFIFDAIILILAGKKDMHESLDEFKFQPDTTTNFIVICPCASEKLMFIFSSPEPKAHGELIVYQSSRRSSVCASVNIFKHEYL